MKNPNGALTLDETLASIAEFEGLGNLRQAMLVQKKLGPNLFSQVIAICDNKRWRNSNDEIPLRIYLASCAFVTALETPFFEPRERIMRTLFDFIFLNDRRLENDHQLVEYLCAIADGINLFEGDRWNPTFIRPSRRLASQGQQSCSTPLSI